MCNVLHNDGKPIAEEGYGYKLFKKHECDPDILMNMSNVSSGENVKLITYCLKIGDIIKWNDSKCIIDKSKRKVSYYKRMTVEPPDTILITEHEADIKNNGFCFFLTKKEALRCKRKWEKVTTDRLYCYKIKYTGGVGTHAETNMFEDATPINIALCKGFTILE